MPVSRRRRNPRAAHRSQNGWIPTSRCPTRATGPAPAGAGPVLIPWRAWPAGGSDGPDAGRLRALRALGDLELHVLVLLQAAEAGAVNLGVVHEDIRSVG